MVNFTLCPATFVSRVILQGWDERRIEKEIQVLSRDDCRAGAQWRSHAVKNEIEEQEWDAETYREWMEIVTRGEGEEAGLGVSLSPCVCFGCEVFFSFFLFFFFFKLFLELVSY